MKPCHNRHTDTEEIKLLLGSKFDRSPVPVSLTLDSIVLKYFCRSKALS